MDKWVPTICMFLSAVLASAAYFLWTTQMSIASDTTTVEASKEVVERIKILIVPGHDKSDSGAEYKDLKEEEINLELSQKLYSLLSQKDEYEVFITRDDLGYKNIFEDYFVDKKEEINNFIEAHKIETDSLIDTGLYEPVKVVEHNKASEETSLKLYGINRWVNENEIDLVVHVHFNDYPRKNRSEEGEYGGFSIYIPSEDMTGNKEAKIIGQKLKENLSIYFSESNLPVEKDIIIENSDLIAVGSNNTLKSTTPVLIEYGYIYEDIFYNKEKRDYNIGRAAYQTYLAINNLF